MADATATERTPDGLSLLFTIDAANENDDALPLRDVTYSVDLDGRRVFSGTRSAEATIRRHGSQRFRLPAVVNLIDTPALAQASESANYRISGSLQYVTPGQLAEVLFDAGVRVPKVGFSGEGRIDLSAARTVSAFTEAPATTEAPPQAAPASVEP